MKLLFDTHAFIWWDSQASRLSPPALAACSDPDNELLLSTASVWEMQIKLQLGKMQLRAPLAKIIADQRANGAALLGALLFRRGKVESEPWRASWFVMRKHFLPLFSVHHFFGPILEV